MWNQDHTRVELPLEQSRSLPEGCTLDQVYRRRPKERHASLGIPRVVVRKSRGILLPRDLQLQLLEVAS